MTASTYDEALKRVLAHEGGYTNHPSDPGGPTNWGITIQDARKYWKARATAADVQAMPVAVAKDIYRTRYAAPLRYDELPAGVDYAVLDYGINSGIARSAKVLQRIVGVEADGEIGDVTLAAVRARDPKVLVAAICDERMAFLQGLKTWPTFGRGWGRRVAEVRAAALVMAGKVQGVQVILGAPASRTALDDAGAIPPWLARMNAILGLYEFAGSADNPAIIGMARACGGNIARNYKHDATPWCALAINYCLVASGLPGNGSLWALDFSRYGTKLSGPALGAIATKKRQGGGHVFLVVGCTADGQLVGRGGNQSDMVCDQEFDPGEIVTYRWPAGYPAPALREAGGWLPIVAPTRREKRAVALPPPSQIAAPGKGVVPPPKTGPAVAGPVAGGVGLGAACWQWIAAHPLETALVAIAFCAALGTAISIINDRHRKQQEAPTPGLVPVAA
jgi:uncharacterized protein (TIGR02594 family)